MPSADDQPLLVLLRAEGRDPGTDASDRRAVSQVSVLWQPPDGPSVAARRRPRRSSPGSRLMRLMGLQAIYQAPRTSDPHPSHRVYPYLLKGMAIERPNQVWCADITYIPVRRGFLYLVAIMDWATRHVLAWRLSNTMDTSFCVEALAEALGRYGRPRSSTPTRAASSPPRFTGALKDADVAISMDGRGRYMRQHLH